MVAQATLTKQGNALITLFVEEWTNKYRRAPKMNRHRSKWGFQDMVTDLGYEQAQAVVRYYFMTGKQGHPVEFLHNNYEKIAQFYSEKQEDEKRRAELRRLTKERVEGLEKNG